MGTKSSLQATPVKRRILIVDDHPLLRRGLTALIDAESDLVVCAEAVTAREGREAIASSKPDLVILDLSLPDGDGFDLLKETRASHEGLPVLVLTMHDAPLYVRRAFTAGASGYVTKHEMTATLLIAIRCVLRGVTYVSPSLRAAQ